MKLKRKYKFGLVLSAVLIACSSIIAQQNDIYFLIKKNFSIFSSAYEDVALEYVDEVDPGILMRNGLDAMLETLDPYTVIFDEAQNQQAEIRSRGNYAGVGIDAGFRDQQVVVIAPVEGGPAEEAGIQAGDVIIAVDGVSTDGLQPEEVSSLMSGESGSEVQITIRRFGLDQDLDFELTRKRIEIRNVTFAGNIGPQNNTAYIRLNQFGDNSGEEVRLAMEELQSDSEVNGLIFDLRDNPGGILQEAVAMLDQFIGPGITVVETRGRLTEYNQVFKTSGPVQFTKPVVVLINGGSASASEILAGTMQDLDRGLILGSRSFGKGLVQVVKPLPYNTSMKITVSRYYIPSGRSIQSLQYTHEGRNSAVKSGVSDQKAYKTRNGRTVYEGRGIEPDIELAKDKMSLPELSLLRQGMYFDFATRYEAANNSFEYEELPDEVFEEFKAYLEEQKFEYETDSEIYLNKLTEELKDVDSASGRLDQVKELLKKEKEQLFRESEQAVRNQLYLELTGRFKDRDTRVRARLKTDEQVIKALDYINSPGELNKVLRGAG